MWDIDEPAAEVVRDIFKMCVSGMGPKYIAKELGKRGLKMPLIYKAERDGVTPKHIPNRPDTMWHTSVVSDILANQEYTGTAILNRQTSKSYKDHRKYIKPEEEWIIHENAHPAIIDNDTFETVQRIRSRSRKVQRKTYEKGVLEGTIYCPDCGDRLYAKRTSLKNSDGSFRKYCHFVCRNSRTYSDLPTCSPHSILRENLETIVLKDLQRVLTLAKAGEQRFAEKLSYASRKESQRGIRKAESELNKAKNRIGAIDRVITKIYEDNVEGKISDERFGTMLASYESEQAQLNARVAELELLLGTASEQTENIESFLRLVRSYTAITELTAEVVHEFIEKVFVGETVYTPPKYSHWGREKTQEIKIIYNYLGDISGTIKETTSGVE